MENGRLIQNFDCRYPTSITGEELEQLSLIHISPYLRAVSRIASSLRCQYSSTMAQSLSLIHI